MNYKGILSRAIIATAVFLASVGLPLTVVGFVK